MTVERRIEAALDNHFSQLGWSIDTRGDHFAELYVGDELGGGKELTLNLTECAKALAIELG